MLMQHRMTHFRRFALALSSLSLASLVGCAADVDSQGMDEEDAPTSSLEALLEGAPDNAELAPEGKADEIYPATFDLFADQSPVRNQASRGVCSIFSTVALMENLYIREGSMPMPDFSEQYLQWSVKEQVRAFRNTDGSSAQQNLAAINRFGIPVETAWPYQTTSWNTSNDPGCTGDNRPTQCYTNGSPPESATSAILYKLPASRYINSGARSIKAHMTAKRSGVIVGGTFYYQSWNHGRSKLPTSSDYSARGYVLAPNERDRELSREQPAGHSFLLIGWDDNLEVQQRDAEGKPMVDANGNPVMQRGFFLFKNSWGAGSFGRLNPFGAGYGWIAYDYVKELTAYASDLPSTPVLPEICNDGRDNDRDGRSDCADADCSADAACEGASALVSTDTSAERRNIPDNNTTGVTSNINVAQAGSIASISVRVNITHTYSGDLKVKLRHPSGQEITLRDREGGSDDNIVREFAVDGFRGLAANGQWSLLVTDGARSDTGRNEDWAITITRSAN
jgi:hypothetical protein